MRKIIVYEKDSAIRYIGHLDLMRTVQRALRRSQLPVSFSKGFHPHVRLSFASPLSVGYIGLGELMDVPFEADVNDDEVIRSLNAVLPPAVRVISCRTVADDLPSLMSLIGGADYRADVPNCADADKLRDALNRFMALDTCMAMRTTKSGTNECDIRPFVVSADVSLLEDGTLRVSYRSIATEAGLLKPDVLMHVLFEMAGIPEQPVWLYRTAILSAHEGRLIPMEKLP